MTASKEPTQSITDRNEVTTIQELVLGLKQQGEKLHFVSMLTLKSVFSLIKFSKIDITHQKNNTFIYKSIAISMSACQCVLFLGTSNMKNQIIIRRPLH